jgi:transcriptional regulator with XRE-family HTH domain
MNTTNVTIYGIMKVMDNFVNWLNQEIKARGWTLRETSRRAGLSQTVVANVVSGRSLPGLEFLQGIAKAFGITRKAVFSRAGIIESDEPSTSEIEEIEVKFAVLSEEDQQAVLRMVRALHETSQASAYSAGASNP